MATPIKLITIPADDLRNVETMVINLVFDALNNKPIDIPKATVTVNSLLALGRTDRITWETK